MQPLSKTTSQNTTYLIESSINQTTGMPYLHCRDENATSLTVILKFFFLKQISDNSYRLYIIQTK